jgi:flagellar hook-length control protein FliK
VGRSSEPVATSANHSGALQPVDGNLQDSVENIDPNLRTAPKENPTNTTAEQLENRSELSSAVASGEERIDLRRVATNELGVAFSPSSSNSNQAAAVQESLMSPADLPRGTGSNFTEPAADSIQQATTQSEVAEQIRLDRYRLIQRVARSFNRLGPDGGNVQLRLHPPELGTLFMQVRLEGRNISARMVTESAAAREVIMDSLPQLRQRLAEQGYEVAQINVEIADSTSNQTGRGDDRQQSSEHPGDYRAPERQWTRTADRSQQSVNREGLEPKIRLDFLHGSRLSGGVDLQA